MGGKFTLAGTVVGVFIIQTLTSTITFLGVPPAVTPVFKALVVIIVCLSQSRRVRQWVRQLWQRLRPPAGSTPAASTPTSAPTSTQGAVA